MTLSNKCQSSNESFHKPALKFINSSSRKRNTKYDMSFIEQAKICTFIAFRSSLINHSLIKSQYCDSDNENVLDMENLLDWLKLVSRKDGERKK